VRKLNLLSLYPIILYSDPTVVILTNLTNKRSKKSKTTYDILVNDLTELLMKKICVSLLLIGLWSAQCIAADTTIEMLNKKGSERMIFSQKIARVDVGDTVFWKAKSKGHNVELIAKNGVPKGVKKYKSKLNKDAQYTFNVPGIYAYWCTPHKSMGMIGFVVVGDNKDNLAAIKKIKFFGKSKKLSKKLIEQL